METTSRLTGESQPSREFTEFFLNHNTLIEELVRERQNLINRLNGYNHALESNLKSGLLEHPCVIRVQVWKDQVSAVDFLLGGRTLVLDLVRWNAAWRLTIFKWEAKSKDVVHCIAGASAMRESSPEIMQDGAATV